jgi:hypothetical protein
MQWLDLQFLTRAILKLQLTLAPSNEISRVSSAVRKPEMMFVFQVIEYKSALLSSAVCNCAAEPSAV